MLPRVIDLAVSGALTAVASPRDANATQHSSHFSVNATRVAGPARQWCEPGTHSRGAGSHRGRELCGELLDRRRALAPVARGEKHSDQSRSDDHTVGEADNLGGLARVRYTHADADRRPGDRAESACQDGGGLVHPIAHPRDDHQRGGVDDSGSGRGGFSQLRVCATRRDHEHGGQLVLRGVPAPRGGLGHRQIRQHAPRAVGRGRSPANRSML